MALDVLISFNAFATMIQVFKRFPLLSPIKYLFAPVKKLSSLAEMESNARKSVLRRIERRGNTPHPDLFEYVLPADCWLLMVTGMDPYTSGKYLCTYLPFI